MYNKPRRRGEDNQILFLLQESSLTSDGVDESEASEVAEVRVAPHSHVSEGEEVGGVRWDIGTELGGGGEVMVVDYGELWPILRQVL